MGERCERSTYASIKGGCVCFGRGDGGDRIGRAVADARVLGGQASRGKCLRAECRALSVVNQSVSVVPPSVRSPLAGAEVADRRVLRAFSLIEVLLVCAVLAMVISIGVVAVSTARSTGRVVGSLSNLRSNHQVLAVYGNDHRDGVPVLVMPSTNRAEWATGRLHPMQRYFSVSWLWAEVLGTSYLGARPWPMLVSPVVPQRVSRLQSYSLTCVLYADVAFWNQDTRTGPEQWRPLTWTSVVFPSRKALLVDVVQWERAQTGSLRGVEQFRGGLTAAVDGSASGRPASEIKPGYRLGDGPWRGAGSWHQGDSPGAMHTLGGIGGVDW